MLLCASKMLRHINLLHYSQQIYNAVNNVLKVGKVKTKDLGDFKTPQLSFCRQTNFYFL
jgi:isocitrate dehydrogenase (NAD+)